jgi:DNA-binding transcriptional LysR family regulator
MELRHLRYFVTTAECLHFTRAAERLNITQSALSVQIRVLESELGVRLLERNNRCLALTSAGEVFLKEAKVTLASAENAALRAQQAAQGEIGRLNIGYVISASGPVVTKGIREFQEKCPGVEIFLDDLPEADQWRQLQDGRIDIALTRSASDNEAFSSRVIAEGCFHVMLPQGHRLCDRRTVRVAELRGEKLITVRPEEFPVYSRALDAACHPGGIRAAGLAARARSGEHSVDGQRRHGGRLLCLASRGAATARRRNPPAHAEDPDDPLGAMACRRRLAGDRAIFEMPEASEKLTSSGRGLDWLSNRAPGPGSPTSSNLLCAR